MFIENSLFLLFSFSSLVFSFFVIMSKNPVHSILSLILVFFNVASLLMFLGVEFLAMLFVIVYVGAVAVLFLFVIMLLNIKISDLNVSTYRYVPMFFVFFCIFMFEYSLFFEFDRLSLSLYDGSVMLNSFAFWEANVVSITNIAVLGLVLYTYYAYPFILSGVILLVSMVGAISLTLHRRSDIKRQNIYKQVQRDFSNSISWRN